MKNLTAIMSQLYEKNGELTPEIVRDAARPDNSPLHAFVFDREIGDAAEEYYLDRAHRLIQRCRVQIEVAPNETRSVRAMIAVPTAANAYSYVPQAVLVARPDMAQAALTEAARRVRQAEDAVDDLRLLLSAIEQPKAETAKRHLRQAAEALA